MVEEKGIRLLISAENDLQARMIEALLDDSKIPHMRKYEGTSLHLKTLFGDGAHSLSIDILVPEPAYGLAVSILEQNQWFTHSND